MSKSHLTSQACVAPYLSLSLSFCVVRLDMHNTGLRCPCIFYSMKNDDLTFRIPPGVDKYQTDSWRIKRRPCLFPPIVQFLPSVSSLFRSGSSGPTSASGLQAGSLGTHYVRLKMRDNSCQGPCWMPLTCFRVARKAHSHAVQLWGLAVS